jgi:hypothetical protein
MTQTVFKVLVMDGNAKIDKGVFPVTEIRLIDKTLLREQWKHISKMHLVVVSERVKEFLEKQ